MSLTDRDVVAAFIWLLGREPEAEAITWHRAHCSTVDELRRHLMNSREFMNYLPFNIGDSRDRALDFMAQRVAFMHLPKTGGTTLAHLLEGAFAEDGLRRRAASMGFTLEALPDQSVS
jgi:hypothetical protein